MAGGQIAAISTAYGVSITTLRVQPYVAILPQRLRPTTLTKAKQNSFSHGFPKKQIIHQCLKKANPVAYILAELRYQLFIFRKKHARPARFCSHVVSFTTVYGSRSKITLLLRNLM